VGTTADGCYNSNVALPDELYFAILRDRIRHAERLVYREVSRDDWQPKPTECHTNVDFWSQQNPEYRVVRGWLVCNPSLLNAHSVLESYEGVLYDITPPRPNPERLSMRFVRHVGTEKEYTELRTRWAQYLYRA
jgi:hypothetical protein